MIMLIEIDSGEAKRLKIKTNQLIMLKVLENKTNSDIKSLLEVNPFSEDDFNDLVQKKILSEESTYKNPIDVEKLFLMDIDAKKKPFDEIYETYPVSVRRPDGTKDYLRTDVARSRRIYEKIVGGSKKRHDEILSALKLEIARRKQEGSIQYMKRLPKWLAAEEWTVYEEMLLETREVKGGSSYGTEIE